MDVAVAKGEAGRQGHAPTLVASFLHFDLSFMLWVLPGALGVYIAESLALSPGEKGLVVAVPILSGALLRIPLGLLSDRFGAKRVGVAMLLVLFLPLSLGWQAGDSLGAWLGIGLLLGTAGASFAVALPLASRWYPAERQGLVMGIAAAGNSGTVIANLAAPRLANLIGWHNVLGVAMVPLAIVLAVFLLLAKDGPAPVKGTPSPAANFGGVLRQPALWGLCLLYCVTFGGYVGMTSFFPIFIRSEYGLSPLTGGYLTALVAFCGSCVRPAGGYLADRFGGVTVLSVLLVLIGGLYALLAMLPAIWVLMALACATFVCLGLGNGSVFQLVPRRFMTEIGAATGIVGALGGLGGFLLPILLGNVKGMSGSFALGFVALSLFCLAVLFVLRVLAATSEEWRTSWGTAATPASTRPLPRVEMAPYLL
ncbi:MAG TPA: MFS transporter [Dehalococcoidia bacterium]|nr:MFS transporter [Dehalococcoidia bacterium]